LTAGQVHPDDPVGLIFFALAALLCHQGFQLLQRNPAARSAFSVYSDLSSIFIHNLVLDCAHTGHPGIVPPAAENAPESA